MNWREYFEQNNGQGYLATADKEGRVNIAPYFRPEVLEDGTLAFAMSDGRSYENVSENPHATYAFNEGSYKGVRVYLERRDETDSGVLLDKLKARADAEVLPGTSKYLEHVVVFRIMRHDALTNV